VEQRDQLNRLEEDNRRLGESIPKPGPWPMNPEQFPPILQNLYQWDRYFETYQTAAQNLHNLGLPYLANRLAQIQGDIKGLINFYSESQQSAMAAQREREIYWGGVGNQCTCGMIETNIAVQDRIKRMNRIQELLNQGFTYQQALEIASRGW